MFVYLSKLLPLFVYPLGIVVVLLVLALIINRKPKWHKALLILALAALLIGSNRWLSYGLARSLEWRNLPAETTPQAEVIVLLGGGTEPGDWPRPTAEVNSAGDRVLYAARLYNEGAAPAILVSGGNLTFSSARGTTPAE
jgi:uncharacterized SAM-binding protein YcdF (DUF218 family)